MSDEHYTGPSPFIFYRNGTDIQKAQLMKALDYISKTPEGGFLRFQLETNILHVEFKEGMAGYDVANKILYWDPKMGNSVIDANGQKGVNSPAVVLAHEMYHWFWDMRGDSAFEEQVATAFEGRIAAALGEPVRASYESVYWANLSPKVYDSTASAKAGGWKAIENGVIKPGPEYDPNAQVITAPINDNTVGTGGGGSGSGGGEGSGGSGDDNGGGGHGPNDPGGSGPLPGGSGGGPKNPIVIVLPAAETPPEDPNLLLLLNASTLEAQVEDSIFIPVTEDPISIQIIGTAANYQLVSTDLY
jgi:hypothetical protein